MRWLAVAAILAIAPAGAGAHIASNGFLTIDVRGSRLSGSLELTVRDLELAVGLDGDGDGKVTWGEVRARQDQVRQYLRTNMTLGDGRSGCALRFGELQINERVDGNYVWAPFDATCGAGMSQLSIDYRVLNGIDPSHRGLLSLTSGGIAQTGVLGAARSPLDFQLGHAQIGRAFLEYLRTGIWHIWSGIDHLLFLLSLLFPAVLRRTGRRWEAVPLAGPAFLNVVKVVTAFTLAHSLTLSLAAFGVIHLPSRLTESVIAASIVVAALNNLFPKVTEGRWRIAFAFGLLHGFGFASVLAEMGLPADARLLCLVAFNLGVELGQLAVVAAVMPLAYAIRATVFYRRAILEWGSSAIAALAFFWMVQRAIG